MYLGLIITFLLSSFSYASTKCNPLKKANFYKLHAYLECSSPSDNKCFGAKDFQGKNQLINSKPEFHINVISAELVKDITEGLALNVDGSVSHTNKPKFDIKVIIDNDSACWLTDVTRKNIGKKLALFLNGRDLLQVANINSPLTGTSFKLSLSDEMTETENLKICQEIYSKCEIKEVDYLKSKK